jgi:thioredoxin 1
MGKNTIELTDANFSRTMDSSDVPVMVDFWAPWCGPCRVLAPIVDEIAGEYQGRLHVGKVNIDDNPALASQFNIRSIPTLLFFRKGSVVGAVNHAVPKDQLQKKVDQILAG